MITEYAIEFIKNTLSYEAKKEIVSKYNASDDQIVDFKYVKDGEVVFRHSYSLIDEKMILDNLFVEMTTICVSQIPINLLVQKGSGDDIIRALNDDFDIRKPKEPTLGSELDIDEPLALASVYNVLDNFGVGEYRRDAKNILTEYERNIEIPDPRKVSSLAFRFSADKQGWHSSYQNGDNYFSIYQNDTWGEAIPLISGSGGGAKNLTELNDFPKTHEKGKILVSTGVRLEWADMPVNGTTSPAPVPTNGTNSAFEKIEYPPDGLDLKNTGVFNFIKLAKETEFNIKVDSNYATLMNNNIEYKFVIELNNFDLIFPSSMTLMVGDNSLDRISSAKYTHAIFNMLRLENGVILVYNINYGSF